MEIKAIVIVKSLADRPGIVVGELPGPYTSEADALKDLVDGQRYQIRDGVMYAEDRVSA